MSSMINRDSLFSRWARHQLKYEFPLSLSTAVMLTGVVSLSCKCAWDCLAGQSAEYENRMFFNTDRTFRRIGGALAYLSLAVGSVAAVVLDPKSFFPEDIS